MKEFSEAFFLSSDVFFVELNNNWCMQSTKEEERKSVSSKASLKARVALSRLQIPGNPRT
jgi:hypothetical protein